jgi:hypothetical protein
MLAGKNSIHTLKFQLLIPNYPNVYVGRLCRKEVGVNSLARKIEFIDQVGQL